ncbi:MAG: transglycosylase domain-containing protein [Dialister invisus]
MNITAWILSVSSVPFSEISSAAMPRRRGSTITQQLARNAFLSQEQTLKRKMLEAFLALKIERQYTKKKFWKCI